MLNGVELPFVRFIVSLRVPSSSLMIRDLRECSGPWSGFWLQGLVRGLMKLNLKFEYTNVDGHGKDPMGDFRVGGMFSPGTWRVLFTKSYTSHSVDYTGTWDGTMIYGRWSLHDDHYSEAGDFEIWPDTQEEMVGVGASSIEEFLSMPGSGL